MTRITSHIAASLLMLAMSASLTAQTTRETSFGRIGQNVTLSLDWSTDNYGNIQWQKSTDNGMTWTDVPGETSSSTTFFLSEDAMYRAHIVGDPSCPPINLEREIKTISFTTSVSNIGYDKADIDVTSPDFNGAQIIEYGYAHNLNSLSRSYDVMPLNKVGDTPPGGDFSVPCTGLRPNTTYSVRFYVKTADGSIIYGPGKLLTTKAGIEFSSENWLIDKTLMRAQFMLSGTASIADVTCLYGTSADNMMPVGVTDLGDGKYRTLAITGLSPATEYHFKVTASVDGTMQECTRTVSTLTDYSSYTVDTEVKPVAHRIVWNSPRVLTKISADNISATEYPRICRIDDNTLILTYHGGTPADHWLNSYYRMSYDNGKTWQPQKLILDRSKQFYGSGYYRICNPQTTLLDNGWVILSATANGNPETNDNCKTICLISKDKCLTWSDPIIVGRGRGWEPHVVQLPGGELELLVSSEKAWWSGPGDPSNDQEIVCARSTDYGQTWTEMKRCSYLQGARDGMPVPILMQGNKGLLFTIESPNGGVRPSVVHRELAKEWSQTPWDKNDSATRWATGLNVGGGAPYCVQIPTGEIVMLCHTNQVGAVWQTSRPQVCLTDNTGHNPRYFTLPATTRNPLSANEGAYYNSLFVKDATHIWLLTTRVTYNGTTRGSSTIEYMEGEIVPVP